MLVALYTGDHAADTLLVRLGCHATRLVQKGKYGSVTHVEAIVGYHSDGSVDIASSSLRDGGVRIKERVKLNPEHWMIVDVPGWDEVRARQWFEANYGLPYDTWGAWATVLPGNERSGMYFCNEAVGASVGVVQPHTFSPATFAALCLSMPGAREVTPEVFSAHAAYSILGSSLG